MDIWANDPYFRSIAYFSMEIGLDPKIPTYAGGLGILAGDTLKSAADLNIPMVGVTLLYRKGYFKQQIDKDGLQRELPETWHPEERLHLLPNEVSVTIENRTVRIRAWEYTIIGATGYRVPVYFLDTDYEANHPEDRKLSWYLYGGDLRYRLCQELVLGVGGLRMLRELRYNNIKTFHLNEGHAGFITLELLREQGYEDYNKIREKSVFTTHTPVAAGHDIFPYDLIDKVMQAPFPDYLKNMLGGEGVSMSDLAFKYSRYVNAVSEKHREVTKKIFNLENVDYITNGIHSYTWVCPGMKNLFTKHIRGWENDPSRLVRAFSIPDEELWKAHQAAKLRLLAHVLETTGVELDPDILTIGAARRATGYKRLDLIFKDVKRLVEICAGKVQFIFAGKAHPKDEEGKKIIQKLIKMASELSGVVKIVFLENYNMELAALLTAGVDVWLNTPKRPLEACGTSGMKAAVNGVLNFSVLDGWWIEGCREGFTGWAIGPAPNEVDLLGYDESLDAESFYEKLEKEVITTYYRKRDRWVQMMKYSIALNGSYFNTHRMLREYVERAYGIKRLVMEGFAQV
ncbi:MAG: alpha-glucan family phosphorylase [Synergistetes bacterium]|nr:alpha-glucan family phosphorylase [Synergistota bacterium]MCX8127820.1 alpha-glucan family phosphorylase [Synergistota bacterium]MDW8192082.1 alpha-glucan family phosphorylase [Synergistota bacterium]